LRFVDSKINEDQSINQFDLTSKSNLNDVFAIRRLSLGRSRSRSRSISLIR